MTAVPDKTFGERFDRALAWSSSLHRAQRRKGTDVPYVSHLLAVAAIAIEHGASEDEAIAALREKFGDAVLAIVEGCTDADTIPKPPWKERKEAYLRRLATAPPSVLLVSCADKLHNVRSTVADLSVAVDREAYWKRFNGGKDGTLWYYRSLGKLFLQRLPGRLSEDLARAVLEMTALASGPVAGQGCGLG